MQKTLCQTLRNKTNHDFSKSLTKNCSRNCATKPEHCFNCSGSGPLSYAWHENYFPCRCLVTAPTDSLKKKLIPGSDAIDRRGNKQSRYYERGTKKAARLASKHGRGAEKREYLIR